jgi:hypothetical protein
MQAFQTKSFAAKVESSLNLFLSPVTKHRSERIILSLAIASYLIHLGLIFSANMGIIPSGSKFLTNPVSAIYTPFSFILVYEVYLLIFYLPQSTSYYIGKQYEIITLIVIRRIFKDLGDLELVNDWFENENDLRFTIDALTSLILFFLIFLFYHRILRRGYSQSETKDTGIQHRGQFILLKKVIALLLVPVLLALALFSFSGWFQQGIQKGFADANLLAYMNNIFFDEFFTILIIVDVLILLASFYYSDRFHTIIRNSGFVLSTILIKVSFSVSGILNNILILGSVLFVLLILFIHQLFEKAVSDKVKAVGID